MAYDDIVFTDRSGITMRRGQDSPEVRSFQQAFLEAGRTLAAEEEYWEACLAAEGADATHRWDGWMTQGGEGMCHTNVMSILNETVLLNPVHWKRKHLNVGQRVGVWTSAKGGIHYGLLFRIEIVRPRNPWEIVHNCPPVYICRLERLWQLPPLPEKQDG